MSLSFLFFDKKEINGTEKKRKKGKTEGNVIQMYCVIIIIIPRFRLDILVVHLGRVISWKPSEIRRISFQNCIMKTEKSFGCDASLRPPKHIG